MVTSNNTYQGQIFLMFNITFQINPQWEVLSWMETSNRGKEIKTLQVKDFICIVDVNDLRSLGYWLNTSVSIWF